MLQANQNAVAHTANVNLVNLRNLEITYFYTFFLNFGTQSALVATIVYGTMSQVPGTSTDTSIIWKYLYWISTTLTIIYSIKALIASLYVSVYAQGKALRGPIGSMVNTVEGLLYEQKSVVFDFSLTILFLAFSTIGMFGIMMDSTCALICTVLTIFGSVLWYNNIIRICNRFQFDTNSYDMTFLNNGSENDPYSQGTKIPVNNSSKTQESQSNGTVNNTPTNNNQQTFLGKIFSSKNSNLGTPLMESYNIITDNQINKEKDLFMSGYLTIKLKSDNISTYLSTYLTSQPSYSLKRRYIVLYNTFVYIYKDKNAHETNPSQPLRKRPIDLDGFDVRIPDDKNNALSSDGSQFIIYLVPNDIEDDRSIIEFHCDTLNESLQWIDTFTKAIKRTQSYNVISQ